MACRNCNHKGYIESHYAKNNAMKPMIKQCLQCNDIKAYSAKVQELLAPEKPKLNVIRRRPPLRLV